MTDTPLAHLASPGALQWSGEQPDDPAVLLAGALGSVYRVLPFDTAGHTIVHLDTVDERLRRAGLSVAFLPSTKTLLAVPREGAPVVQSGVTVRWPALVDAVPDGPVRDLIAKPMWVRALVPYARTSPRTRTFAVLNGDEKTVLRLTWVTTPGQPDRVYLLALRGYDKDARAVTKRLRAKLPLAPATTTWFEAVPRAQVDRPASPPMTPEQHAAPAVAAALLGYLDEIEANVAGVLDDIDTEFLHDLRVAVRRTRSVVKLVGDVLPRRITTRAADEFRWLGTVTTPTRDLDVYLLGMDDMAASIANPSDLVPFGSFLQARRAKVRRELVRALRSERFTMWCATWRAELTAVVSAKPRGRTVARLADERLHKVFGSVSKRAREITAQSPADDVHTLRKKCKELRYLLELFEPICDRRAAKQVVADFKELQNVLGEFQDGEVQAATLREFAQEMIDSGDANASTVLAMGDLAGRFDIRQRQARAELTDNHDSYLGKSAAQHVNRLIRS